MLQYIYDEYVMSVRTPSALKEPCFSTFMMNVLCLSVQRVCPKRTMLQYIYDEYIMSVRTPSALKEPCFSIFMMNILCLSVQPSALKDHASVYL